MFGFGLKCNVRGCSKFGLNVWRTSRTSGGNTTPLFSPSLTDHSLKLGIDMKYNSPIKSFIVLLSIVLIMSMNFYIGDDETTHFKKKLELQWPKIQNY